MSKLYKPALRTVRGRSSRNRNARSNRSRIHHHHITFHQSTNRLLSGRNHWKRRTRRDLVSSRPSTLKTAHQTPKKASPLEPLTPELADLHDRLTLNASDSLQWYIGSALIDMLRRNVLRADPDEHRWTSHAELEELADDVADDELEDAEIPEKYWVFLRGVRWYVPHPNYEMGYNTVEDLRQFALLLSQGRNRRSGLYDLWADVFPFVYRVTVEEAAKKHVDE